ncbi:MAG TPA: hypothetical protein VG166_04135 [Caulobacteraceae bacterium]|jgi:hypothetical protein|nr:hypothetical protein [Caulobacteraceae bacterium]
MSPHAPLTPWTVFELAAPLQQGLMVALALAMAAAAFVLATKLRGGRRLDGGSAYLSGLRLGGPIIGALGAAFSLLNMTLGYASVPGDLPLKVLAPGFAEAFLQIGLGCLAGVVAVGAHWAVESRIDRQVLGDP